MTLTYLMNLVDALHIICISLVTSVVCYWLIMTMSSILQFNSGGQLFHITADNDIEVIFQQVWMLHHF